MSNSINELKDDAEKLKNNLEMIVKEAESYKEASDIMKNTNANVIEMTKKFAGGVESLEKFVDKSEKILGEFNETVENLKSVEDALLEEIKTNGLIMKSVENTLLKEIKTNRLIAIGVGVIAVVGIIISIAI